MNRTEALQAAFMIAGPNVTAEEHIQYAEFLLGDENEIVLEDRISKVEADPVYQPDEKVYEANDDIYPVGAKAVDRDGDSWEKKADGWWYLGQGNLNGGWLDDGPWRYDAVFVA